MTSSSQNDGEGEINVNPTETELLLENNTESLKANEENKKDKGKAKSSFALNMLRFLIAYFVLKYFLSYYTKPSSEPQIHNPIESFPTFDSTMQSFSRFYWSSGDVFDIFLSHQGRLLHEERNIAFGDYSSQHYRSCSIPMSIGSVDKSYEIDIDIWNENWNKTVQLKYPLIVHIPKEGRNVAKKLFFKSDDQQASISTFPAVYPKLKVQMAVEDQPLSFSTSEASNRKNFDSKSNEPKKSSSYFCPLFFVNDFWNVREKYVFLNTTQPITDFLLVFEFEPISMTRFQWAMKFAEGLRINEELYGTDGDDFRKMIGDTNPYLLLLTFFVTLLHTIFDILAFKNDISFWKSKGKDGASLAGLSLRSISMNIFSQSVILLYLVEEGTSWIILTSSLVGFVLEVWKLTKAFDVRPSLAFPYFILRERKTYADSPTQQYDTFAWKVLLLLSIPCLLAYSVYSFYFNLESIDSISIYRFVLKSCVGFIYTFGFVMMTPQLYINYKLKSVAAMPWRTFVYKALNTFIDDLFAWIIQMPTMHRIACLRDDVIFLVYLYQRWIYPVDLSRCNEFGQSGKDNLALENDSNHAKTE